MNLHSLLHVMWLQCWCSAAQARIAEGHRVQADADYFNEHQCSPTYLKDVKLPACVKASCDPPSALSVATHLIHAVPCQYSRKYLEGVAPLIPPGVPVVCTSKGIEAGTLAMMNDVQVDL